MAAELAGFPHLERLILWRVKRIGDDAADRLARMKQLTVLDLAETAITDRGMEKLQSMKELQKLYLSGSAVTGPGVEAFRRANPRCDVSWL